MEGTSFYIMQNYIIRMQNRLNSLLPPEYAKKKQPLRTFTESSCYLDSMLIHNVYYICWQCAFRLFCICGKKYKTEYRGRLSHQVIAWASSPCLWNCYICWLIHSIRRAALVMACSGNYNFPFWCPKQHEPLNKCKSYWLYSCEVY